MAPVFHFQWLDKISSFLRWTKFEDRFVKSTTSEFSMYGNSTLYRDHGDECLSDDYLILYVIGIFLALLSGLFDAWFWRCSFARLGSFTGSRLGRFVLFVSIFHICLGEIFNGKSLSASNESLDTFETAACIITHRERGNEVEETLQRAREINRQVETEDDQNEFEGNLGRDHIEGAMNLWNEILGASMTNREGRFTLAMHGLTLLPLQTRTRSATMSQLEDMDDVIAAIREAWMDQLGPDDRIEIVYVVPQPTISQFSGVDAIHVICDLAPELGGSQALATVSVDYGMYEWDGPCEFRSFRVFGPDNHFLVIRSAGVLHLCLQEQTVCHVHRSAILLNDFDLVQFEKGDRFDVSVHLHAYEVGGYGTRNFPPPPDAQPGSSEHDANEDDMSDDRSAEDDDFSFMVTQRSERTSTVYVYQEEKDEPLKFFPPTLPYFQSMIFVRDWMNEGRFGEANWEVALVKPQPHDLESRNIIGIVAFRSTEAIPHTILAVIDVEIYNNQPNPPGGALRPGQPAGEWRQVSRIPEHLYRHEFFRELKMGPLCNRDPNRCLVSCMGRPWKAQETAKWWFFDGAFCVIRLPSICDEIPLQTQWDMTQAGNEIPQIIDHWKQQRQMRHDASSSYDTEGSSSLQTCVKIRPSEAHIASSGLAPPGNGVKFDPKVQLHDADHVEERIDRGIDNEFVYNTVQFFSEAAHQNEFIDRYVEGLRYDMSRSHGTEHHDEFPNLPISHEVDSVNGLGKNEQNEEAKPHTIDFGAIFRHFQWFDTHFCLPDYFLPEGMWKESTKPWTDLPIFTWKAASELHFYGDGSKTAKGTGAGVVLFVFSEEGWQYGGFKGFRLEGNPDAFQAEMAASAIAHKWAWDTVKTLAYTQLQAPKVVYHFDSQSAGHAAVGSAKGNRAPIYHAFTRAMAQLMYEKFQIEVEGCFVRAHQGQPGNEAADVVANLYTTHQTNDVGFWKIAFMENAVNKMAWFWFLSRRDLTHFWNQHNLILPKKETVYDQRVVDDIERSEEEQKGVQATDWNLCCFTYNAMTMNDKKDKNQRMGPTASNALLKQFDEAGGHVVTIQETKLRRPISKANPYFHLLQHEARDDGTGGILIGISKQRPLCHDEKGNEVKFKEQDLRLIHSDPDLIIARITNRALRVVLIGAHAPHSGKDQHLVESWWKDLRKHIKPRYEDHDVLFLGDSNGRVGSNDSSSVGCFGAELENHTGAAFHEFLQQQRLWALNTFREVHEGDTTTWISPQGSKSRLDYICAPLSWRSFGARSFVAYDISSHRCLHDHMALCAKFEGRYELLPEKRLMRGSGRKRILMDVQQQHTRAALSQNIRKLEHVDWSCDVHRHAHYIHEGLRKAAKCAKPKQEPLKRKDSLSEETWELVQRKRACRQNYFEMKKKGAKTTLMICFAVWRGKSGEVDDAVKAKKFCDVSLAVTMARFAQISKDVTKLVRRDDQIFFDQLAERINEYDRPDAQKKFWTEVKRCLPKTKERKRQVQAIKVDKLNEQWVPHVQKMEAGQVMTLEQIYADCLEKHEHQQCHTTSLAFIPSLTELENAMRGTSSGKMCGPEQVEGDWLHALPCESARFVFDLMFKFFAWKEEPVQYKGGSLIFIPKKGSLDKVENHRAIMLAANISKRLHSILRPRLMTEISKVRPPMQLGGFQHQEVSYGSQYTRTLTRVAHACRLPSAILFVDLRTAFHALVRQLVIGKQQGYEEDIEAVYQSLRQENNETKGLQEWLKQDGFLQRIGTAEDLVQLLKEINTNTWCQTYGGCLKTNRGTKPGSPLADSLFHAIMSEATVELNTFLDSNVIFQNGVKQLQVQVQPVLWADDLAIPLFAQNVGELQDLVQMVCAKVHHIFANKGLTVNYDKGKTELVPSFRGQGAPEQRRQVLMQETPGSWIQLEHDKKVFLRYQGVYRHLGVQQESNGELDKEIGMRVGQAWSAFRSICRCLLCNRRYKLSTRMTLLNSLIFSKLFFGAGAWTDLRPRSFKKLETAYMLMLRKVGGFTNKGFKDEQRITDVEVRRRLEVPSLKIKMTQERLLYANRLFSVGEKFSMIP